MTGGAPSSRRHGTTPTCPPPRHARTADTTSNDARLHRQGRETAALANAGQYARAAARLASDDSLADLSPDTVARLHALHPAEQGFEVYIRYMYELRTAH